MGVFLKSRILVGLVFICGLLGSPVAWGEPFAVYHVGNSLTGDMYNLFRKVATDYEVSKGNTYTYGVHFRSATGVTWMFNNPTPGPDAKEKVDRTVSGIGLNATVGGPKTNAIPWTVALPGNHWDVVTMQPSSDTQMLTNLESDTKAINGIIEATKKRADNADTRFFIYTPWPSVKYGELESYKNSYLSTVPNDSLPTRQFVIDLAEAVRKTNPGVGVIPAGEVLYVLDDMMRAGKFEHFKSIQELHRDRVHLNSVGQNVVSWVAYAVIFKQSPVGLSNHEVGNSLVKPFVNVTEISPADLKLMQQTIWDVVTQQSKYTNVK
jgi:hypothetical protein